MSNEKQILQLHSQGYSQRRIAETLHISRNTVAKVFKAADQLSPTAVSSMDDESLHLALFPEKALFLYRKYLTMFTCIRNF